MGGGGNQVWIGDVLLRHDGVHALLALLRCLLLLEPLLDLGELVHEEDAAPLVASRCAAISEPVRMATAVTVPPPPPPPAVLQAPPSMGLRLGLQMTGVTNPVKTPMFNFQPTPCLKVPTHLKQKNVSSTLMLYCNAALHIILGAAFYLTPAIPAVNPSGGVCFAYCNHALGSRCIIVLETPPPPPCRRKREKLHLSLKIYQNAT